MNENSEKTCACSRDGKACAKCAKCEDVKNCAERCEKCECKEEK